MTYKDIFTRAFSDIYTRFPLSDTETICRNVTEKADKLHVAENKSSKIKINSANSSKKYVDKSLKSIVLSIAALSLVFGAFVGIYYFWTHKSGLDITTPGYTQRQAEIEESKKLDQHQITDEERSETGTTNVGLSCEFDDITVKVSWYKFDGAELIIKYSATFYGDIPEDISVLPRPTTNKVDYPDDREFINSPSFEKVDVAYRDGNTFYLYAKIEPVSKLEETLDIAIDNRRIDGENSPYLFTAVANIPEDKQPVEIALDSYITVPEDGGPFAGVTIHLTKLTIMSDKIIFWFDDIPDSDDGYTIITILTLRQYARVVMKDGSELVFDGGYGGGGPHYSCNLTEESAIDPRDVCEVYLCGEPVYLKSAPENDISGANSEMIGFSGDNIYFDTVQYGSVLLEKLNLTPTQLEISFAPSETGSPIGGGRVRAYDLSVVIAYHDGSVKDISGLPHSTGVETSAGSSGSPITTLIYDLSENRVAPRYVVAVIINDVTVPLGYITYTDGTEMRNYTRRSDDIQEAGSGSDAPFPSAIDAQNISPSVQEGGLVGTTIDPDIQPDAGWITLPPEDEENIVSP